MIYALLISEQKLKQYTPMDSNVEMEEIRPFIIQAQDLKLQSLLGTNFMQDLMAKVDSDSLNEKETELIKYYIQPLLANYTLYLALPNLAYKIHNKAIVQPTSEESTSVSLDIIKYLRDAYKNNSDFYVDRLTDYLCDYSNDFPLYTSTNIKGMQPMTSKNNSGIYLPKTGYRRPNGYDKPKY